MKKIWLVAVAFILIFASYGLVQTLSKEAKQPNIQPKQLVGEWLMGTFTGFDCDLKINSNNTLTAQFGGCFHRDPAITTSWKLQGDKIEFQDTALDKSLGSHLQVVKYKGHFVLVPEHPQKHRGRHKYSYYHCFWRNTMKKGLQLPKEAPK